MNIANKNSSTHIWLDKRITVLAVVVFLFGAMIVLRLFWLQIMKNNDFAEESSQKHVVSKDLLPNRGSIYVKDGSELYPIVTNKEYYQLYAEPIRVESPNKVVDTLTPILGLADDEWKELLRKLQKQNDPYEPIKKKVTKEQIAAIDAAELDGIGYVSETYRFYPEENIGGHIFGFVGFNGEERTGQYGLEGYFNEELSGKTGFINSIKDALGSLVTIGPRKVQQAEDGVDLVLTIDRQVQYEACQKLKKYYDWFEAESGSVIIMEPSTGEIIAMCSFPDFNPELYNEVEDINHFNNPVIFYDFEPGSIFKAVTMAAALDVGAIEPETTFEDEGEVVIGPYTVKNADLKSHGVQTMTQVLEKSLNTGTIFAADKLGKKKFKQYLDKFGFGEVSGIELDTEVPGNLSSLDKRGEIFYLTASYGQGITVTPLQMVSAFAAIANGGTLMKPQIVSEIIINDEDTEKVKPEAVRRVVDQKTSTLLTGMLTSVVENGFGEKAAVDGYYFAGKTGTAQVASDEGGYGADTIHSYVGYGPVTNPKFVMMVKLDKPKDIRFASDSVAPLFGEIASYLVDYYNLPRDY